MNGELDGALPSSDPNEMYYVGVIDLLVAYGKKKKVGALSSCPSLLCALSTFTSHCFVSSQLEAQTRGRLVNAMHGADSLSVTDPKKYSSRLLAFIEEKTPEESGSSGMLSSRGSSLGGSTRSLMGGMGGSQRSMMGAGR